MYIEINDYDRPHKLFPILWVGPKISRGEENTRPSSKRSKLNLLKHTYINTTSCELIQSLMSETELRHNEKAYGCYNLVTS